MIFPSSGLLSASATAELSPTTAGGVREQIPRRSTGEDVIQKNWQELIRPNKLQVTAGSDPAVTWSLFGLINSCQFFWITSSPVERRGICSRTPPAVVGESSAVADADSNPLDGKIIRDDAYVAGNRY